MRPSQRLNVPLEIDSFVGRAGDAAGLEALVGRARLVTVAGPGGVGKTRLATRVGAGLAGRFEDGVCWVDLAPVSQPDMVASSIMAALGFRNYAGTDELAVITSRLRQKQCLLVLDNCEHLIGTCATLAHRLLLTCPGVTILATSREALGIPGEAIWRVDPLDCPEPAVRPTLENVRDYPAVQLFVERAVQAAPGFTLTEQNLRAAVQVCTRLDGLPLAIELAAAQLQAFSVGQIAAHLDQAFSLLTAGNRTAQPRQQTLRGTLDWGYALLSPDERLLFARLAVFAGGWSLEGAEAVCAGNGMGQGVMTVLAQLVGKSLVVADRRDSGVRYRFLQTVHDYALEHLEGAELGRLRAGHFAWCLRTVASPTFFHGPGQDRWLRMCDAEYQNLRAALEWAVETGLAPEGAELAAALWFYWDSRGLLGEWQTWLRRLTDLPGELTHHRLLAVSGLSYITLAQGDVQSALALDHDSLHGWRTLQSPPGVAWAKKRIGIDHLAVGDLATAEHFLTQALDEVQAAGPVHYTYLILLMLGDLHRMQQRYVEAAAMYERSLHLMDAEGDAAHGAHGLVGLACVRQAQGRSQEAHALVVRALQAFHNLGERRVIAACLDCLSSFAVERDDARRAVRLLGAASALREAIGAAPTHALFAAEQERALARARALLPPPQFAACWNEGMALGYDGILQLALTPAAGGAANALSPWPPSLTPREREIAGHLVERLSNRTIAARLFISEQTVETHVKRVLSKLGVSSRHQVAERWGAQAPSQDPR